MPPPKRFRVSAKNYFLTFPHCTLTKEEALAQLQNVNCNCNKKFIKIRRELHQDGGEPRLHVLLQFQGNYVCTNSRQFDLVSPTRPAHFQPYIQGAKSSSDVKSYMDKDGDTIHWGDFQIDARRGQQSANDAYAEALNSGSAQEALRILKEKVPKDFAKKHRRLTANLDMIFSPPPPVFSSKWDYSTFIIPDDIQQWVGKTFNVIQDNAGPVIHRLNRSIYQPMSIVIEGPSGTGKTAWARSLGMHNYIAGRFDLNIKNYSDDVEYNVVDDVPPSYLELKHWKLIMGAKRDWQFNSKHRRPILIKGGIPAIVLCSPGEGTSYKDFLDKEKNKSLKDWTIQNVWFIKINAPLYQSPA